MQRVTSRILCVLFGISFHTLAHAADIPPLLQPWQDWVLHDHPEAQCPHLFNTQPGQSQRLCLWPGRLSLDAHAAGGTFAITVEAYAGLWLELPGNNQYWPQDVQRNDEPIAVAQRGGKPQVWLEPGEHTLRGGWQWDTLPRMLPVPDAVGLVQLRLNEQPVNPVNRNQGQLWLKPDPKAENENQHDNLSLKVFRRVEDGNPGRVETLLQLNVSGREREVTLGPLLLAGLTPLDFTSALPARLEPDGTLRIQLRPGRHDVRLLARSDTPLSQLSYTPAGEQWPAQEVWVFEASRALRTVRVEGVAAIDASQTQLPGNWQHLPAYLMTPESTFNLEPIQRGQGQAAANALSLSKTLWLDFSGQALTALDLINGELNQGSRLDTRAPYQLKGAEVNGTAQLITGDEGNTGVELRQSPLNLQATSRVERQQLLPVSGWQQSFEEVNTTIHLPPGWAALHISGADRVYGSWISQWNLWNLFLLLVISVAIGRVLGWPAGVLAFATLLLIFQRPQAPVFSWLNLTAALALLPFARGKLLTAVRIWLGLGAAALVILLLPFYVQEARLSVYPHLEQNQSPRSFAPTALQKAAPPRVEYDSASRMVVEEVMVSSARTKETGPHDDYQAAYDPEQKVQLGPGQPHWQWKSVTAHWSGPVTSSEDTRLWLASPLITRLGHLLAIALTALLLLQFARHVRPHLPATGSLRWLPSAASLVLAAVIGLPSTEAKAAIAPEPTPTAVAPLEQAPSEALLNQLRKRLLAPPECLPQCTAIESAQLSVEGEQLIIDLVLHNQAPLALPLPGNSRQWWPGAITVNDKPATLLTQHDNTLFIYLREAGRQQVTLSGPLNTLEQATLDFHLPLHNVTTDLPSAGWAISGLPVQNRSSETLQLTRQAPAAERADRLLPEPAPAFVTVTRDIRLGKEWTVNTRIERMAPAQGAIQLALPLLPGEAPVSGHRNSDGSMDIRLGQNQRIVQFQSTLPVSDQLQLTAPEQSRWSERWQVHPSSLWHLQYEGIPPLADSARFAPTWAPWPGEQVTLRISKPRPAAGEHLVIDRTELSFQPGQRVSDATLTLELRASYGQELQLPLPEHAELKHLAINGSPTPATEQRPLRIPLTPGTQTVELQWQAPEGVQAITHTPQLALPATASNINLTLRLPADRWVLAVGGPTLGPAVIFWGVLAVVLLLSIGLASSGLTPLRVWEWVLLSLGVATFNVWALALIAVWFVALNLRGRLRAPPQKPAFNALQVLLFVLSALALLTLVSAIPGSLLSAPQMYVTGNGSSAFNLNWYQDRASQTLPTAWVLSLPLLAYRLIMLAWSLWLAFALMRWIRWGWLQLGVQGYWLETSKKKEDAKRE